MTDVQNDMAWRHQMLSEVQPLDRPTASPSELKFVCRNPLSWNYGVEVKLASSKASSRSKSSLRSSSYASLTSGPARSSLLSMELDHERKMREAMEREVQELKAKLSRMDPSMLPAAGLASKQGKGPKVPCWQDQESLDGGKSKPSVRRAAKDGFEHSQILQP
ncbi:unnamed protein product [Durusdinium trenchii]|uniref:Uncharacterized protein n=1 Tax=Durusdinium trenchii TaxID=1381693 RepID=A0ABP0JZ36_9DINO